MPRGVPSHAWKQQELIVREYADRKLPVRTIAALYGTSYGVIYNILRANDVQMRPRGGEKKA